MLSGSHFYHRTVRKLVVAFGTLFNNIRLVRYDATNTTEIERINVPLAYANKEKFYKRITEDPNLANPTQTILPRMAFEMGAITYDPLRKTSSHISNFYTYPSSTVNQVRLSPYNFDFNLYLYVRNNEDGFQIVEQILPYFTPDYTLTVDFLNNGSLPLDVPIVFNSINYEQNYEGDPETTRVLTWSLNFEVKGYMIGPTSDIKLIKKVTANVATDNYQNTNRKIDCSTGTGKYKQNELVYQGPSVHEATARAYVSKWDSTANNLYLYDVSGDFVANTIISGVVSRAKYNVSTVETSTQLVNITVQPNPLTANVGDDFGFTTIIEEYPKIDATLSVDASFYSVDSNTISVDLM